MSVRPGVQASVWAGPVLPQKKQRPIPPQKTLHGTSTHGHTHGPSGCPWRSDIIRLYLPFFFLHSKPKNLKPNTLFFFFSYIDTYPENLILESMQVQTKEPRLSSSYVVAVFFGFQDLALRTWVSGPRSQDLSFRTQTNTRNVSYGRLIFFPSFFSASIVTFLFPVT